MTDIAVDPLLIATLCVVTLGNGRPYKPRGLTNRCLLSA